VNQRAVGVSRRQLLAQMGAGSLAAAAASTFGPLATAAAAAEPWQPTSDRKIRLGVVGGGFGAAFQWHKHPNCQVVAVSDLQPERLKRLQQVYQCDKTYESLEKLVLDKQVEAVAVFTDAPSHARHSIEVMNHGKHVICAVPAAMTLEECQAVRETKEKTGLKYMMAETSYYHREVIRARNLYRQGCRILYTEGQYYHHAVTRIGSWKNWRRALPPMLYPTHSTAYYVGVTGKRLTKVSCLGWRGPGEEWVDNQYKNPFACQSALFRTSEDTFCRINVFWWGAADGETGSWIWESAPKVQVPDSVPLPAGLEPGGHGGSHGPLVHEFICALVEQREPAIDVYESLAMTAPGIVAHQSALKDGEQLAVPQFDKSA